MYKNPSSVFPQLRWNLFARTDAHVLQGIKTLDDINNYSYDNNLPSSLDEIFSNHTNELVDLANFELDFNTNFQDLDLSNNHFFLNQSDMISILLFEY